MAKGTAPAESTCPECSEPTTPSDRFCRSCGHGLAEINKAPNSAEQTAAANEPDGPEPADSESDQAPESGEGSGPDGEQEVPAAAEAPTLALDKVDGATLAIQDADQAPVGPKKKPSPREWVDAARKHPRISAGVVALSVVVVVLVIVLVAGGGGGGSTTSPAQIRNKHLVSLQKQLTAPFSAVMQDRDSFFAQEAQFVSSIKSAQSKLFLYTTSANQYNDALNQYNNEVQQIEASNSAAIVACEDAGGFDCTAPNSVPSAPNGPTVPDLSTEISQLRQSATLLDQLQAQLNSLKLPSQLNVLNTQFLSSVSGLSSEANQDADILTEAVIPANQQQGTSGSVDAGKASELRTNDVLPAIQQMNAAALTIITELHLPIAQYDIAGGHDTNPNDDSQALPTGVTAPQGTPAP
jgi:hypothetical protein